jgi:(S)-mandelate dehydrogenase
MQVSRALNIEDLAYLAKRSVPRAVYSMLEGASEDEIALRKSVSRIREFELVPRVLRGASISDQTTTIFGRKYATFLGIAPTGNIALLRSDIEYCLSRAAATSKVPMILSGASAASIEDIAQNHPGEVWSQLYAASNPAITEDMIRRAAGMNCPVLVWTVDNPCIPKNERHLRVGLVSPPRVPLAYKLEALTHLRWVSDYLSGKMTKMESWRRYAPQAATDGDVRALFTKETYTRGTTITWQSLKDLRKLWKGSLVVKGVLHPDDARCVADLGADGIIVSNHGGYGLDRMPAAIDMLPEIVEAVGDRITVMMDSGIRRGTDAIVARCLGAKFVFVGRAPLFGAAAGGERGALHAINILKDEIDRAMSFLGCARADLLTSDLLRLHTPAPNA